MQILRVLKAEGQILDLEVGHVDDLKGEDDQIAPGLNLVGHIYLTKTANAADQPHFLHLEVLGEIAWYNLM